MTLRISPILLSLALFPSAWAHLQPTTLAVLDADRDRVNLTLHLPLPELELAFGHKVTNNPEQRIASWQGDLQQYLLAHTRPSGPDGRPWSVQVTEMSLGRAQQTQSGPFQEVNVRLVLIPPSGQRASRFQLSYDAIIHQVVTHKALVSVRGSWSSGQADETHARVIGINNATSHVDPLAIDLDEGGWFSGTLGMVRLGMQHIREGLDHLLFLIVLLLPAMLTACNGSWMAARGSDYGLGRVARIVSAFTLGHSVTLAAGALHWFQLPQQPVEILIAASILVTAVHAMRPIFPGSEAKIAAGFGLVHGMAFASAIADLNLAPGPLALSIFGFNVGIELMQLLVIALTMPWLILLSRTRAYTWIRLGGAGMAAVAAAGWMINRITGQSNLIEKWTGAATQLAPLGIVLLAVLAITAYFEPALKTPAVYTYGEREQQS